MYQHCSISNVVLVIDYDLTPPSIVLQLYYRMSACRDADNCHVCETYQYETLNYEYRIGCRFQMDATLHIEFTLIGNSYSLQFFFITHFFSKACPMKGLCLVKPVDKLIFQHYVGHKLFCSRLSQGIEWPSARKKNLFFCCILVTFIFRLLHSLYAYIQNSVQILRRGSVVMIWMQKAYGSGPRVGKPWSSPIGDRENQRVQGPILETVLRYGRGQITTIDGEMLLVTCNAVFSAKNSKTVFHQDNNTVRDETVSLRVKMSMNKSSHKITLYDHNSQINWGARVVQSSKVPEIAVASLGHAGNQ